MHICLLAPVASKAPRGLISFPLQRPAGVSRYVIGPDRNRLAAGFRSAVKSFQETVEFMMKVFGTELKLYFEVILGIGEELDYLALLSFQQFSSFKLQFIM